MRGFSQDGSMRQLLSTGAGKLAGGILAGAALTLGLEALGADAGSRPGLDSLRTIVQVWNKIKAEYVTTVGDPTLERGCIRGMLATLDAHSSFQDPPQVREMAAMSGAVGLVLKHNATGVEVTEAIPDTPAARADIRPGSVLLSIDGERLSHHSLNEVVDLLRGPIGSTVELDLVAPGAAATTLRLKREPIRLAAVRTTPLGDGYLYARVPQFTVDSAKGMESSLAAARTDGPLKGMVLDLRRNGGGVLNGAIDFAAMFLGDDQTVMTLPPSRSGVDNGHQFNGTAGSSRLNQVQQLPIVILVGADTSSGAEIVASALQDNHRATVLGQRTAGNADVQTITPLSGGGAMKLTTNYWRRASGGTVDHVGIEPDVRLDGTDAAAQDKAARLPATVRGDAEVQAALDYLRVHVPGEGK
jgi:carboxyl-terminal processing protease